MTLNEELYFEITLKGVKSDLKKFIDFLKSGELDEFFEFSTDFPTRCGKVMLRSENSVF